MSIANRDEPALSEAPGEAAQRARGLAQFRWYLALQASWFLGFGSQMVLFPYLVADRLAMPPQMVGYAQVALMGPSLLLLLVGGVTADRVDTRRLLTRLHLLATVPPLALAGLIAADALSYGALIAFGLAMGTISAFTMPARDSLLTPVVQAGGSGLTIQRAVMLANMTQFGAQLTGMIVASLATFVGVPPIFVYQSVALATGAYSVTRTPPVQRAPEAAPAGTRRTTVGDIGEAFGLLLRSQSLTVVTATVFAVGVLAIGSFLVAMPILVRDEYGGGSARFATFSLCFWSGTFSAAIALTRKGRISRPGRAMMASIMTSSAISLGLSVPGPFWLLGILSYCWGCCAGVNMTMSRSLIQEAAPFAQRARLLSIYQLGYMGGAPVGATAMGFVVAEIGPHAAFYVPSAGLAAIALVLFTRTRFWSMTLAEVVAERDRLWAPGAEAARERPA
ncbi:MAG: MFS transporter [Alphaproteobacteria bacterium]|nr:MFS transporter [Alphaproteobacteria bacterium]